MALLNRISNWVEPSIQDVYRCMDCDGCISDALGACPECGGDIKENEPLVYHYFGPF